MSEPAVSYSKSTLPPRRQPIGFQPTLYPPTSQRHPHYLHINLTPISPTHFAINLFLLLLTVASLSIASYFALTTFQLKNQLAKQQRLSTAPVSPPVTAKKDYQNFDFLFSLSFPENTPFEINPLSDSNQHQLVFSKGQTGEFSLLAQKQFTQEEETLYRQIPSTGQRSVAGKIFSTFSIPASTHKPQSSTESAATLTPAAFALRLKQNNILYTFIFPGQQDTLPWQDNILSSLKFNSPPSPSANSTSSASLDRFIGD